METRLRGNLQSGTDMVLAHLNLHHIGALPAPTNGSIPLRSRRTYRL